VWGLGSGGWGVGVGPQPPPPQSPIPNPQSPLKINIVQIIVNIKYLFKIYIALKFIIYMK
jgi:hypothetical protein